MSVMNAPKLRNLLPNMMPLPASEITQKLLLELDITHPEWEKALPDYQSLARALCAETLNMVLADDPLVTQIEISVLLADNLTIQQLNRDYRHKDAPTNVLSFPSYPFTKHNLAKFAIEKYVVLGDIVLALETLIEEANARNISLKNHFSHLLIHGMLHLIGFDHETSEEAVAMEALEIAILERFDINSPYSS